MDRQRCGPGVRECSGHAPRHRQPVVTQRIQRRGAQAHRSTDRHAVVGDLAARADRPQAGCDAGDPTSCRQLGVAYLEGRGLPKSTSAAAVWLERACMPDDPAACRLLGLMRIQGTGVPRDVDRGRQLLVRACAAKDDEACRAVKALDAGSAVEPGVGSDVGSAAAPSDARKQTFE